MAIDIGADQARIDCKGFAADQLFLDAAPDGHLEDLPQEVALTEPAVPVLGKGRVIGNRTVQAQPAKPSIGEIEMHLLA